MSNLDQNKPAPITPPDPGTERAGTTKDALTRLLQLIVRDPAATMAAQMEVTGWDEDKIIEAITDIGRKAQTKRALEEQS